MTSPLRAPFTVYQGQEGPAELKEEVRGKGAQKAVGELITCPFCIDMWVATGLMAGFRFGEASKELIGRARRMAADCRMAADSCRDGPRLYPVGYRGSGGSESRCRAFAARSSVVEALR